MCLHVSTMLVGGTHFELPIRQKAILLKEAQSSHSYTCTRTKAHHARPSHELKLTNRKALCVSLYKHPFDALCPCSLKQLPCGPIHCLPTLPILQTNCWGRRGGGGGVGRVGLPAGQHGAHKPFFPCGSPGGGGLPKDHKTPSSVVPPAHLHLQGEVLTPSCSLFYPFASL